MGAVWDVATGAACPDGAALESGDSVFDSVQPAANSAAVVTSAVLHRLTLIFIPPIGARMPRAAQGRACQYRPGAGIRRQPKKDRRA